MIGRIRIKNGMNKNEVGGGEISVLPILLWTGFVAKGEQGVKNET